MRPKLEIIDKVNYDFDLELDDCSDKIDLNVFRLVVKNSGKSAAKNCKAYIKTQRKDNRLSRVCWTLTSERPNATINRDSIEELDLIGFDKKLSFRIKSTCPNENDWPKKIKYFKGRSLDNINECEVLITASNAKSARKTIMLDHEKMKIDFL